MKKTIFTLLITAISLTACTSNWNKEYVKKGCINGALKQAGNTPEAQAMVIKLCDCTAEKMTTKYKTEEEANKDVQGVMKLTTECQKEMFQSPK